MRRVWGDWPVKNNSIITISPSDPSWCSPWPSHSPARESSGSWLVPTRPAVAVLCTVKIRPENSSSLEVNVLKCYFVFMLENCRSVLAFLSWLWLQCQWVRYWDCQESLHIYYDSQALIPRMGGIRVHCRLDLTKIFLVSIFLTLDKVAQEMKAASKVPNIRWTLADLTTAAWLAENGHLTKLEMPRLAPDLEVESVSEEMEIIRRVTLIKGKAFVYFRSFEENWVGRWSCILKF